MSNSIVRTLLVGLFAGLVAIGGSAASAVEPKAPREPTIADIDAAISSASSTKEKPKPTKPIIIGHGQGYETETGVFGLTARGDKFVYVFDRSLSMADYGGRPLRAAKRELIDSIEKLGRVTQFQVIFYNQKPSYMNLGGGPATLLFGDDDTKKQARAFIEKVAADGSTQHVDALKMALQLQPDVVFFLTDADDPQFSEGELKTIRERNRGGSHIHTIEFGAGPQGENASPLQRMAEQNDGQHRYVDVTKLPRE